ncbi:MAG: DUF2231 domain-containing protein [Anaerolineales bacterium]|nr:DUF2231 domain-containing protein [Anaerolineales bacterium]
MFDFLQNIWLDLHPIIVHFAIGGLFLSFALTLLARFRPNATLNETSWILLVVGVVAAIPATVTGLIAHFPYEDTALAAAIEPHQFLGMLGTLATLGLAVWRFNARRKGRDIGAHPVYVGLIVAGLVWVVLLGGTGGNLVYELGINVRGVNPLLP